MKVYVDSSWLLRVLLKQGQVRPLPENCQAFSSVLLMVECQRSLDRQHKRNLLSDANFAYLSLQLTDYLDSINLIELDPEIVMRATEPFILPIGSLDALHLATAIKLRKAERYDLSFATFDEELAMAATAHGFNVLK